MAGGALSVVWGALHGDSRRLIAKLWKWPPSTRMPRHGLVAAAYFVFARAIMNSEGVCLGGRRPRPREVSVRTSGTRRRGRYQSLSQSPDLRAPQGEARRALQHALSGGSAAARRRTLRACRRKRRCHRDTCREAACSADRPGSSRGREQALCTAEAYEPHTPSA